MALENLEPATRIESILDGEDIAPATRIESILTGADIEPATRLEYFLKKASESGGGGGSSDFSTATMTISGFPSGLGGGVSIGGFAEIEDDMLMSIGYETSFQNGTYVMVLYKGTGYVACPDSITVSGNAEYDGEEVITVTGDFTISPQPVL